MASLSSTTVQNFLEKRRDPRQISKDYLRVYSRLDNHLIGRIIDFSASGLRVLGEMPLVVGQSFEMILVPPEYIEHTASFSLRAKSVWCRKDENPNYYLIGFYFTNAPKNFIDRIC